MGKAHEIEKLEKLEDRIETYRAAAESGLSGLSSTLSSLGSDLGSVATTYTEAATLMSTGWKDDDGKKEMGVVSLMADATKRLQSNGVENTLTKCADKMKEVYDFIKETYDEYEKIKPEYDKMVDEYAKAEKYTPGANDKWNSETQSYDYDPHEQAKIDEWENKPATKDKRNPQAANGTTTFSPRIFPPNNNYPLVLYTTRVYMSKIAANFLTAIFERFLISVLGELKFIRNKSLSYQYGMGARQRIGD